MSSLMMANTKRPTLQDIPFLVDGVVRVVKTISKHTTCNDVISKLPNLDVPLAVFLSKDGEEKELTGKTRLMKVWRANCSSCKMEFVIKKSETASIKSSKQPRTLFGDRKRREKQNGQSNSVNNRLSKESLKQVSDLAFYVRYQKLKLKAFSQKSVTDNTFSTKEQKNTPQSKLMKKMTSHASTNSMDAFLAKADLDEMARFLTFCGKVTSEKLQHGSIQNGNRTSRPKASTSSLLDSTDIVDKMEEQSFVTEKPKRTIHNGLKIVKLGLKQKFNTTHNKLANRTISTGTIHSTDTGYGSVDQEKGASAKSDIYNATTTSQKCIPRGHTVLLDDIDGAPRHSTPVGAVRQRKRRADCNLTRENLNTLDDCTGKTTIFERFMADQTMPNKSTKIDEELPEPDNKRQRHERFSLPAFRSQKAHCRFLWNKYSSSSSDTESESDASEMDLDVAFMEQYEEPRRLRRESAISNLNRFSLSNRCSLPAHVPTLCETKDDFNYSFDCSFPRIDESQSFDFSFSFSESETSRDNLDQTKKTTATADDSMDSFMKTKISFEDTLELTYGDDNILERNVSLSDEGFGSVTSGSLGSGHAFYV